MNYKCLSLIANEIVRSYEVEIDNKTIPIRPIDNVCSHNILPWKIHGGKLLYAIEQKNETQNVDCDDVMAIEIFTYRIWK